jgi:hypothetical protein
MLPRGLIALALLAACTPDQPTTPPEKWPDLNVLPREADQSTAPPAAPAVDARATADTQTPAIAAPLPASSREDPAAALVPTPRGDRGLPGPRGAAEGGCEGGARSVGESWKVACNECACGDDGQVTCTAMACGYR